ncbi:hypothetical protein K6V25_14090 [Bacteroides salyersiae]|uniref:hypothetical protein n=1 Tax=Bacteroides salyersiae TaxID=291644 RepID=UPI001CCAA70D|nr:hypothetical protein [Bacteroides salyersiae]UBD64067.1 hypothetical protein K6V25_14090 [Bacteroides salyersiae]
MDVLLKESDIRRNSEIEATQLFSDMLKHVDASYHILAKRRVNGNNFAWEIPTEPGVSWHKLGEASDIEKDVVYDIIKSCKKEFKKISTQLSDNIINSIFATPNDDEYIFYSINGESNKIRVIITAWGYSFPAKTRGKSISLSEQVKSAPQHVIVTFTKDGKPVNGLDFNIITPNGLTKNLKTNDFGQKDLLNNKVGSIIKIEVPTYNTNFDLEVIKGTKEYYFDIKPIITEPEFVPEPDYTQDVVIKLLLNSEPLKLYAFNVENKNGVKNHFITDEEGKTDISNHNVGTKLRIWVNNNEDYYDLIVKEGIKEYLFNIEPIVKVPDSKIQDVEIVILQNSLPVINLPIAITCNNKPSQDYLTDNNGRLRLLSQNVGALIKINVPDYNENFNLEVKENIRVYTFELKPKVQIKEQNVIAVFLQDGKAINLLDVLVRKNGESSTKYTTNEYGQIFLSNQEVDTSLMLEVVKFDTKHNLIVQEGVEEYIFNLEKVPSLSNKKRSKWWLNLLEILVLIISAILFYLAWPYVWDFANTIVNAVV